MADSEVRRKLLTYLHQLPDNQSVSADDLTSAIGLPTNQVIPSLTAAKKRGEVETLPDGCVRLSSATRGGFRDGKVPFRSLLPDAFAVPFHILNQAISQVPAVKYALGVAGIAGAGAIIYLLLANLQNPSVWVIAGMVVLVTLLFMVVLFVFAKLTASESPQVQKSGIVLIWFVLLLFMAVCILLATSVFFRWPRDVKDFFSLPSQPSSQAPPKAFVYEACVGVTDRRLPDDALGRADDDRLQPRQWMWSAEDNSEKQLGDCKKLWLLTDEFAGSYQDFVAHVNVAASKDVIVSCHLLQPDGVVKRLELKREKPTPKEGVVHYFSVPESRKGNRLLVFVAMPKVTYEAISHDPKFKITKS